MCNGKCGECCRTMRFELFDADHEYWVRLHGVKVVDVGNKRYAQFPIKCEKLKGNLCSIYKDRPEMCRRFICKTLSK